MDSFVLTALCIPCIIIACSQGGRKEERRERGGNCAERKATADPSVRLNALEAQRGREQCLILRGVGLVLDLFFLSFFFWSIDEKKPALGSILPNQFFRGVISGSKVYFFFFSKSCHVWDYACDGLSHHPPLAHTLLPLRHRGWSKSYQSCLAFFYLFMYLTLSSRTPHSAVHRARRSMLDWRLGGMASAVFEGTSLVNMFVRDCWVNGIRRLIISQSGEEEEFFEIRTEWSDRNILYLHRSYSDLGRLFRRLVESFPEDRRDLSKSPLIEGWCDSG